jgi:hypothetical protein
MPGPVQRMRGQGGAVTPQPLLAPNWFLGLVPRQYWNVKKEPYIYELDFSTTPLGNGGPSIAANATVSATVQVQQDSHFLCTQIVALVTTTDNLTLVYGNGATGPSQKLITVVDAGPNQPVSNVAIPLDNIAGSGQQPSWLGLPKLFEKGGGIGVTLQNLNTTTAHTVRLSFWGIRIYWDKGA